MSRNRHVERTPAMSATPIIRPGEGSSVPVVLGDSAVVNGIVVQTAAVNLSEAPVPERKYVADTYGVVFVPGTVQLLFGQRRIGVDALRSLLIIQMTPFSAARFLGSMAQLSPISLEQLAEQNQISAEMPPPITSEPDQTVALAAGLVLTAASSEETTLDFYQASAFSVSAMQHTKHLHLDPVVRIDLRTSLMLGLVEQLRMLGSKLPSMSIRHG